ncbi:hypothetical protein [Frankia sp. AgKG'84/4]|uniref:hypothetical protein n=1 Tax=Frankia sp. AgKG'84/4 TaxID=573490 RepID=UPI00200CD7BC|nr:hypothetical protein [Frankia sp. AgKG'84/4]MCL9793968.1 hypothetical protein [Frankia sp. AgKG'84/4]
MNKHTDGGRDDHPLVHERCPTETQNSAAGVTAGHVMGGEVSLQRYAGSVIPPVGDHVRTAPPVTLKGEVAALDGLMSGYDEEQGFREGKRPDLDLDDLGTTTG